MAAITSSAITSSSSSYCSSSEESSESGMESREEREKMSKVLVTREESAVEKLEANSSSYNNQQENNVVHSSSVTKEPTKNSIISCGVSEQSKVLENVKHQHNALEENRWQEEELQENEECKQNAKCAVVCADKAKQNTSMYKDQFSVHSGTKKSNYVSSNSKEYKNKEWASSTMDPIATTLPPSSSSSSMSTMLQMECEQLRRHYLNKVNSNINNNVNEEKSHNAWSMEENIKIKPVIPTVTELQDDLDALSGEVSRVMQSARPPTAPSTFLSYCKSVRTTPTEVSLKEVNKHNYKYEKNGETKDEMYTTCNNKDKNKKKDSTSGIIDNHEEVKIDHVDEIHETHLDVNNKNVNNNYNKEEYKKQTHTRGTCNIDNDNVVMPTTATADNEDYEYVTDDNLQALSTIKEDHYMSSINAFTIHHVQNTKKGSPHVEVENQLHFLSSSSSLASLQIIEEEEELEEEQQAKLKGEEYVQNDKQIKPKAKLSPIRFSNNENVNNNINTIKSNSTQTTPKVKASHDVQRRLGVRSAEIHSPRTIFTATNRDNNKNKTMITPIRSAIVNDNVTYNKINKISSTDNILSTSPTLPPSKLLVNRLSRSNAVPTNVASSLETALQSLQEEEHQEQWEKCESQPSWKNEQLLLHENYSSVNGKEGKTRWDVPLSHSARMRNVSTIYNTFLTSTDITKTIPSSESSSSPFSASLEREETRPINEKLKTNRGKDEKNKQVKKEIVSLHLEQEELEEEMEELQNYLEHDDIVKHLKLIKRDRLHEDNVITYTHNTNNVNNRYKTKEQEEEGEVTHVTVQDKLIPPLPFSRLRALHATPTSYTSSRLEEQTITMSSSKGTKLLSLSPSPDLASLWKSPILTSNLASLQSSPSTSRVAVTSRTMTKRNNVMDDKKKGMKMRSDSCSKNNRKIRIQNGKSVCSEIKSPSEKSSEVRDGRIKVIVRKRPLNVEEEIHGCKDCVRVHDSCRTIQLSLVKQRVDLTEYTENTNYTFDHVFDGNATNVDIHNTCVKELLQVVLNGGRASCFAYGQTGSGKTYTMMGEPNNNFNNNKEEITNESENTKDGLYLLGARELFAQLSPLQCLCVAFYEIYCNSCFDLLNERQPIVVREDATHKINICHLTWHTLHSMDHLIRLVGVGLEQRRSGSTNANERSSRSHAILSIRVMKRSKNNNKEKRKQKETKEKELQKEEEEKREPVMTSYEYVNCDNNAECVQKEDKTINNDESDSCKYNEVEEEYNEDNEEEGGGGVINYVDLAGSERAADTSNEDKTTRKEGAEINKSLLALKECIRALDEKRRHVPFRGCKLTEILRDSFIGNSRTIMIATISPSAQNYEHSANTLRYAFRVQGLTLANVSPSRARNAPRLTARSVPEQKNNKEEEYSKQMIMKKKENNNNKKEENIGLPLSTNTESKILALGADKETASPVRLIRRCKSKVKRDNINDKGEAVSEQSSQVMAFSSTPSLQEKQNKLNQENKLEQKESRVREKPRWNRPTRCISQPVRVTDNLRVNSTISISNSTENVTSISKEYKVKKKSENNKKYQKEKLQRESNAEGSYLKGSNEINTNNDIRSTYTNRMNNNSRENANNMITISSSSLEHNGRLHDHYNSDSTNNDDNNNTALSPSQDVMLELLSDQSELYSVNNAANEEFADEKHKPEQTHHGQYNTANEKYYHINGGVTAPMIKANGKGDINCKDKNIVEQIEKQLRSSIMQQVQRDLSNEIQRVLDERDALIASLQAENKELKRRVSELEKITTFSTHDMLTNTLPPPPTHSSYSSSSFYAHKINEGKNNVADSKYNEGSNKQNVISQNNNYYDDNDNDDDDDIDFFYYEDDDDLEYNPEKCNSTTVKNKSTIFTNSHDRLGSPNNNDDAKKETKSELIPMILSKTPKQQESD